MTEPSAISSATARPSEALSGSARVPGDKSISHRALMIAGLAVGESRIDGLLEGADVLGTAAAMRALGAEVVREANGAWRVWGRGLGGLCEPEDVIDLGNSGTGARLIMGILAAHPITAVLTGDASLRARPMARVATPLVQMGAQVYARAGCRLPLTVVGTADPLPLRYRLPVPSAQVKSAILLAGLNTPGATCVVEPAPTRDHSELMLRHFGAEIAVETTDEGRVATVTGRPELSGRALRVPADPSSAAFVLVAALLLPGSEVRLPEVGVNPHRTGLLESLREMGADIRLENRREAAGEPVADLLVRAGTLEGIEVPAARAPTMIDEYPILAVAAACAKGRTVMRGLGELRVKESDRLAALARGLSACGVEVEEGEDSLVVHGRGGRAPGGATIATGLDHRIAMSFLVLGLAGDNPVTIDDAGPIDTSFPDFIGLLRGLGADLAAGAG
jgi:3-phosphoshikimate 1-carboxyvinyltransferase